MARAWRMVALGDSYSAGTGALAAEAWPAVLVSLVEEAGGGQGALENLARDGSTSTAVWKEQVPQLRAAGGADLITLMVGANDVVRGVPASAYRRNCADVLDAAEGQQGEPSRIWVLSSPDFGATPGGRMYGRPEEIATATATLNHATASLAAERRHPYFDLTPLFMAALARPGGLAADGLHYSAATYRAWAEALWREAQRRGLESLWGLPAEA